MPTEASGLTERQKAWMASVREGLQRETGRSMAEWAQIARSCPETRLRARLAWFKNEHGLGQNRASMVLFEAFKDGETAVAAGEAGAGLWVDPAAAEVFEAVRAAALALPDVVVGQRKTFTAFSRGFQFAAARPLRKGGLRLGLAAAPDADPRFAPRGTESWSERLKAKLDLRTTADVGAVEGLLKSAWERS